MKRHNQKKPEVHTIWFERDEPKEVIDQKVREMRIRLSEMKKGKEEKTMAEDNEKKKKKVVLKPETRKTIETMVKEGKSVPSIVEGVEKVHSQKINVRHIQAIYSKLCYRDKKFYDVPELFQENGSKAGVLRPVVWSEKRGIMISAKRIQDTFPDLIEHLKGGETTFDIEAVYDKKKKVIFTLTSKAGSK